MIIIPKDVIDKILDFRREVQLNLLTQCLKENRYSLWFILQDILEDTSVSEGGMESEILNEMFDKDQQRRKDIMKCI